MSHLKNMFFLAAVCFAANSIFGNAMIPAPNIGHLVFCYTFECFKECTQHTIAGEKIFIGMISYDISRDAYTSLYIGNIQNTFSFESMETLTVVMQVPEGSTLIETGAKMIQAMSFRRSIFVSYEHGFSSFGIKYLESLRKLGLGPQVIYHMNHERPWSTSSTDLLDHLYESTDQLAASYDSHPLVLRNYYYKPLVNCSHYIPVGIPYYSYLIGGEQYRHAHLKPASQRSTVCHFKGRLNYDVTSKERFLVDSERNHAFHVKERRELLALSQSGRAGPCLAEEYDPNSVDGDDQMSLYQSYVARMADTAFALCPAGNNPETFRHYEALELGAIPIFLRPHADKNFLEYDLWSTYPGPVLTSWADLEGYMHTMTPTAMDTLQHEVFVWYANFKRQSKGRLEALLLHVFSGNEGIYRNNAFKGRKSEGEEVMHWQFNGGAPDEGSGGGGANTPVAKTCGSTTSGGEDGGKQNQQQQRDETLLARMLALEERVAEVAALREKVTELEGRLAGK